VSAAADQARAVGCKHLVGGHLDADGFVRAVGARDTVDRVRRSVLRFPLTTPPVSPVEGYRVVSWTGAAPAELLESYAAARNAINDAPHDESIDDERYTPERIRAMESSVERRDTELRVTVAVAPDGEVAGFTDVRAPREAGAGRAHFDAVSQPPENPARSRPRRRCGFFSITRQISALRWFSIIAQMGP